MWHDTRRGHNLIRKRYSTRNTKQNLVVCCIVISTLFVVALCAVGIYSFVLNNKDKAEVQPKPNDQEEIIQVDNSATVNIYDEPEENINNKMNITVLGEIMMGGDIGKDLGYNYKSAFKTICEYTSKSDYTMLTLATNIIDKEKIEDTKSKYLVNKNIMSAFNALGVDGVNIATDHMLDFDMDIFNETKQILDKDCDIIGLKDGIVYVEANGIKVAVIGVCNEVIGLERNYTAAGIMMYNLKTLKSMIAEAKKKVDTVIMMTHLGLELNHQITNVMQWFYETLVDYGADIVLGTHAIGVYPIEIYKGKAIVYSTGYLMSDTDYTVGKKTGIFDLKVNEQGKLESIKITPLYINAKKQTLLYRDYDKEGANEFLQYISSELDKNTYSIKDYCLTINLK